MELLRTLGVLIEAPSPDHRPLAELLELGPVPPGSEHTDLFGFQLYPYASVYLGAEGRLGGEARDLIAGFWRALAQAPPAEPDHLTVMLALYAELRERESCGEPPGEEPPGEEPPGEEPPGEEPPGEDYRRRACRAFLWEHLLSWLPVYLDKLDQLASRYYRRWAVLLREALSTEAERLGRGQRLPLHLRRLSPLADPRKEGSRAFLDSLLSPVRSGMILVRDDLIRAGRELDLGVRAGERKFVLEALLSQDPAATLEWLARECRAWAARHGENAALLGTAADSWIRSAEASSTLLEELSREARAHFA